MNIYPEFFKTTCKNTETIMCYNDLEKIKKSIIKRRRLGKFIVGYELFMSLLLFTTGIIGGSLLITVIGVVLFILFVFSFNGITEDNHLLQQLSSICSNQMLNKTYEKRIKCSTIKLYTRHFSKTSSYVFGVVLTDENKNKYYYFFDEKIMSYYDIDHKALKNKFHRELDIKCFENTSIIKTIENNPYFLQFTYRNFAL